MSLRLRTGKVEVSGAEGEASGSASVELRPGGRVVAIRLDYDGLPAGTEVTVTDGGGAATQILKVTGNTDKTFYPVVPASKAADGSDSALTESVPFAERLSVAVEKGDDGGTVAVTALVEL